MDINKYGRRIGSQYGEAGIIEYILTKIGSGNKELLEIGYGTQSNTVNLLSNHGWYGWLFDMSELSRIMALARWEKCKPVTAFITRENVNDVLSSNDVPKFVDLISIDIDGNDYWIWEAVDVYSNILVIEYNATFGDTESITIEYKPDFDRMKVHPSYHGASLVALTKLAKVKGYALIGCESNGVNAFFINRGLLREGLEEISPKEAYRKHVSRGSWRHELEILKSRYKFVEV